MTRIIGLALVALAIGIAEPTPAVSQNGKDLVGTWRLISARTDRDGSKSDIFGANANGMLIFNANGRYAIVFIAANLPKFASNNRATGTADENKAVIVGSLAHFGTYVVDVADKSFTFQIDRVTFPNWQSKNLKRSFVITGDELQFTDPHASAGGFAAVAFKRAR
jgi:hypothetical protein